MMKRISILKLGRQRLNLLSERQNSPLPGVWRKSEQIASKLEKKLEKLVGEDNNESSGNVTPTNGREDTRLIASARLPPLQNYGSDNADEGQTSKTPNIPNIWEEEPSAVEEDSKLEEEYQEQQEESDQEEVQLAEEIFNVVINLQTEIMSYPVAEISSSETKIIIQRQIKLDSDSK